MTELTRKQREIRDREILIKNTARTMLKKDGFHQLSMDKLAEKIEYSKGTVYQHFNCKEELTGELCLESVEQIISMFKKAIAIEGSTRERMVAVLFAYILDSTLNPEVFQNLQIIKSDVVRSKLSEDRQQQMMLKEAELFGLVASVVFSAIECGDLNLNEGVTPQDVVFGLWSTAYGGLILESTNIDWAVLGLDDPLMSILKITEAALDGLGWKPHSSEVDINKLFEKLRTQTFADEFTLHKDTLKKRSIIHG